MLDRVYARLPPELHRYCTFRGRRADGPEAQCADRAAHTPSTVSHEFERMITFVQRVRGRLGISQ
jgi:hypothetical protein